MRRSPTSRAERAPGRAPAGRSSTSRAERAPGRARMRPAIVAVAVLAVVVFLGTFVFPTRTFLSQRAEIAEAREQLAVLEEQSAALAAQADTLRDDAEIERLAREQYNLVKPGEEAYALLPTTGPADEPPAPGSDPDGDDDRNPVRKAWDALTGLF